MLVYHRGSSGVKYPGTLFTRVEKGNFAKELLNLIARLHLELQRANTDLGHREWYWPCSVNLRTDANNFLSLVL